MKECETHLCGNLEDGRDIPLRAHEGRVCLNKNTMFLAVLHNLFLLVERV